MLVFSAWAQDQEAGITKLGDRQRLLEISSSRPLDAAASLLASAYQLQINAEDPPFACG